MRWLLDIIAVLTAGGLIAAVLMYNRTQDEHDSQVKKASTDLRRIELEIKYRAVTKACPLNDFGWPLTIDPAWFDNDPPRNMLLTPKRPWLEVAGEAEGKLMNPRIRMAIDDNLAGFWYNPVQGVIRARVPVMLSDQEATNLYNRVNQTTLWSVFDRESETIPGTGPEKSSEPVLGVDAPGVDLLQPTLKKPVVGAQPTGRGAAPAPAKKKTAAATR